MGRGSPPGDTLLPLSQRARPARRSTHCGIGAGSPHPHHPRPEMDNGARLLPFDSFFVKEGWPCPGHPWINTTTLQCNKNQKPSNLNPNPSRNNNTNKKSTSCERKRGVMCEYEHRTSYLTYMQMGSFRFPLGMGTWSQEVSSKHTNSAILFYNNMSQWTAYKVTQRRQGSNEHSGLRPQKSTNSASMEASRRVHQRPHNIPQGGFSMTHTETLIVRGGHGDAITPRL